MQAGDMDPIPRPERLHRLQSNEALMPQLPKPVHSRAHALQQEKPPQREDHAQQ